MRVLYVYYGTAGLAGAYIHGIAQSVREAVGIEYHLAVNRYYKFTEPESKAIRPFFPLTELTTENHWLRIPVVRLLRRPIRYVELMLAYLYLLFYIIIGYIDVVNLSLIDDEVPTALFAMGVKAIGRELFVTAHDTIPYGDRVSRARRCYVFDLADRVVVHYEHVKQHLVEFFGVPSSKISSHPYPWSEVASIIDEGRYEKYLQSINEMTGGFRRVFLFIGVLRPEKGLVSLASAWRRAGLGMDDGCLLLVAGKPVPGLDIERTLAGLPAVELIDRRLDDEEFWALLTVADVVVLPYAVNHYAHSSVALTSFLASRCIVASDIPLFKWLIDDDTGYRFKANDVDELARVLIRVAKEDAEKLRQKGEIGRRRVMAEWSGLSIALTELYSPLCRESGRSS